MKKENPSTATPRRALRTTEAAKYLGISASLLRKMRARGPDDPLGAGPAYIKVSPSLVVYQISALDSWLDRYVERQSRTTSAATCAA
jgi:predicted DNA-binding transcriptional regulator AlpA